MINKISRLKKIFPSNIEIWQIKILGRYWYECIHGHLRPMGCFTPLNERLELYEKFVQNGYEMQCVLENGYLQFRFTACISEDGKRHGIGEIWEDERVSIKLAKSFFC